MKLTNTAKAFAMAAALFTTALTSQPLQIAALGAGGAVMLAGEAMAQNQVPGVGIIVKKKPGNGPIANGVSDDNGEVVFKLEPGEYSVTVGRNRPQDFKIGRGQSGIKVVVTGNKEKYVGHVTLLR